MKKDVGMRVRVDLALRGEFLAACRSEDRSAAQVIRDFMRRYVAEREAELEKKKIEAHGARR